MKVGSLFSGIGGLELGLERAGMEVRWQVEWDDWCTKILEKHWPDVPKYKDIHNVNPEELEPVDLICGGFPCQPVSYAGARKAQDDDRWLWPQFARIVRVVRPRYVLVENVPGLLSAGFGDVAADLAALGYDFEWESIPAAAVGAPHLRYRVFIVAYPNEERRSQRRVSKGERQQGLFDPAGGSRLGTDTRGEGYPMADTDCSGPNEGRPESGRRYVFGSSGTTADTTSKGLERTNGDKPSLTEPTRSSHWAVEPDVGRVANGIPRRVDRLRGLGNAVVPQVAQWVGEQIMSF